MEFLNVKTGDIYDGNLHSAGEGIFVHYFEGQQSINGIYSQLFVIIDDSNSNNYTIEVDGFTDTLNVPNNIKNSTFFLIDKLENHTQETDFTEIDDRDFYNLDKLKVASVETKDDSITGTSYGIHWFWVGCSSANAGEIRQELKISLNNTDTGYITVGADFYDEDEPLQKNLENFGFEIPSIFQKALFPENLREDLNDNIILNRKRRELLTEYWNLIANKGSYDSLLNSLKFFEYGDLVRIEEYWERLQSGRKIYLGDDLSTALDDRILEKINVLKRTTYCGLYLLLNKYVGGLDEETNPITEQIDDITLRWIEEDLAMKMTLLGNFFSTYFMPIHLDLLHSSIERRVFTLAFNTFTGATLERRDYYNCCLPLTLRSYDIDSERYIPRTRFYLEDTNAYVYSNTIFGNTSLVPNNVNFIGVEPLRSYQDPIYLTDHYENPLNPLLDTDDNSESSITAANWFEGIGKIVRYNVSIPNRNVDPNDSICRQTVIVYNKDESTYKTITTYVYRTPEDGRYDFDFWLLFTKSADYIINVEFNTFNGRVYTGRSEITVLDSGANYLEPYRVTRVPVDTFINSIDFFNEVLINNYPFCITHQDIYDIYRRSLLVTTSDYNSYRYLGINSTLMLIMDENVNGLSLGKNGDHSSEVGLFEITSSSDANNLLADLNSEFGYYWWDLRPRYITIEEYENSLETTPQTPPSTYVLIGVRKAFTITDEDDVLLNEFDLKVYNSTESLIQNIHIESHRLDNLLVSSIDNTDFKISVEVSGTKSNINPSVSNEIDFSNFETVEIVYNIYDLNENFIAKKVSLIDLQPYSEDDYYGTDYFKVIISDTYNLERFVDEERFYPILHQIEKLEEPCEINKYETIAIVPKFEMSKEVYGNYNWEFINFSNTENNFSVITDTASPSKASREPFVTLDNNYINKLTPGYYKVKATIKQDNRDEIELSSCTFKVSK